MYCDKLETALRFQNQKLADELQDCKRDKRDLQTQLQNIESQDSWVKEVEELRVRYYGLLLGLVEWDANNLCRAKTNMFSS